MMMIIMMLACSHSCTNTHCSSGGVDVKGKGHMSTFWVGAPPFTSSDSDSPPGPGPLISGLASSPYCSSPAASYITTTVTTCTEPKSTSCSIIFPSSEGTMPPDSESPGGPAPLSGGTALAETCLSSDGQGMVILPPPLSRTESAGRMTLSPLPRAGSSGTSYFRALN